MVFGITTTLGQEHDVLVKTAKIMSFVAALLTLLTGIIHIFSSFRNWCQIYKDANPNLEDIGCFGPWLVWNKSNKFTHDANNEMYYRSVFSLDPNIMFRLWTPFFLGLLAVAQHLLAFSGAKGSFLTSNWSRVTLWHFFLAFFGNYGWAGNWGIMTGFFICPFAVFIFLLTSFLRPESSTSMGLSFGGARGNASGNGAEGGASADPLYEDYRAESASYQEAGGNEPAY